MAKGSKSITFPTMKERFTWKFERASENRTVNEWLEVKITMTYKGGGTSSFKQYWNCRNTAGGRFSKLTSLDGERHHMPAKKSIANSRSKLTAAKAPAIRMTKAEHKNTKNWGNRKSATEERKKETKLINQGKFLAAQKRGTNDVQNKCGAVYGYAIKDMVKYTKSLGYKK